MQIGDTYEVKATVTDEITAQAAGSGTLRVFGTPFLVGMMETAGVAYMSRELPEGKSTVGTMVMAEHISPTPVGMEVTVRVTVTNISENGKMVDFDMEAFDETVRTGVMTYWSRSRQELWVKGLTSGHFQYLKEMRIDCDNDTILVKVAQVGAACHTGNRSCFYRTVLKKEYADRNPMKIFESVYDVIEDRKAHPKEGSYTNYLFEKGIDKILKKCGEEAAEIIIAAKNPNPEEIKYEIADFLYHVMVLMSERGITWEDVSQELANR